MSRSPIRNFRIPAAEGGPTSEPVMRKSGNSEFPTKSTEAEAGLKKIEATQKKRVKK
jgi:hypothetical protein